MLKLFSKTIHFQLKFGPEGVPGPPWETPGMLELSTVLVQDSSLVGGRRPRCFPGSILERFLGHFGVPLGALLGTFWELKSMKFFFRFLGRFGCPFGCLLGSKMGRFGHPVGHWKRKGDTCKKLVLLKENHTF